MVQLLLQHLDIYHKHWILNFYLTRNNKFKFLDSWNTELDKYFLGRFRLRLSYMSLLMMTLDVWKSFFAQVTHDSWTLLVVTVLVDQELRHLIEGSLALNTAKHCFVLVTQSLVSLQLSDWWWLNLTNITPQQLFLNLLILINLLRVWCFVFNIRFA